jgi:hypothetical protein
MEEDVKQQLSSLKEHFDGNISSVREELSKVLALLRERQGLKLSDINEVRFACA